MSKTSASKLAAAIELKVKELHDGPFNTGRWNSVAGQWLVYGFERHLGFSGAVGLEATVENAFKHKKSIHDAVVRFLTEEGVA